MSMLDASFLSQTCPRCGAPVRPEFSVRVSWPTKGMDVQVLPELDRISVYRDKADAPKGVEILVGYPELFERVRELRDGLDPRAVEIVKYYLLEKAEESEPDADVTVLYHAKEGERLVFHVLGFKSGDTGVVKLPVDTYSRAFDGLKDSMSREPFQSVFQGAYRSINKLAFLDDEEA